MMKTCFVLFTLCSAFQNILAPHQPPTPKTAEFVLVCYSQTCADFVDVLNDVSRLLPVTIAQVPTEQEVPQWAGKLPAPLLFLPGHDSPKRFSSEFSTEALSAWLALEMADPLVPPAYARIFKEGVNGGGVSTLRRSLVAVENEVQFWLHVKVPEITRSLAAKCVAYYYQVLDELEHERHHIQHEIDDVNRILNDPNVSSSEHDWATARLNILRSLDEALTGATPHDPAIHQQESAVHQQDPKQDSGIHKQEL